MERVVVHRPGGRHRLVLETAADPTPGPGQVRVRTEACGVNYADVVVRLGLHAASRAGTSGPITPGFEFAGAVDAVGPGAPWSVGDAVFGVTRLGGYATHVVVPAHQVFRLPAALTMAQAAAFPAVYLTAYHAIHQNVVVRPEMVVLVHSAAGGVGTALLQLGALAGCRMVGVVSGPHKLEVARAFGATDVIDTSAGSLWAGATLAAPEGYDLVFDANGASTLRESYRHLRPTGKLVCYGFSSMLPRGTGRVNYLRLAWALLRMPRFNPMRMALENRSVITFSLANLFERPDLLNQGMEHLLKWLRDGRLRAPAITTFPLAAAADAHQALESGRTTGKLVLLTGSGAGTRS